MAPATQGKNFVRSHEPFFPFVPPMLRKAEGDGAVSSQPAERLLDEYLVASARIGDRRAFGLLVRRWNGKLQDEDSQQQVGKPVPDCRPDGRLEGVGRLAVLLVGFEWHDRPGSIVDRHGAR